MEEEVRKNGFEDVLTTPDGQPISTVVEEKLRDPRHGHISIIKHCGEACRLCYDEMLAGWCISCTYVGFEFGHGF